MHPARLYRTGEALSLRLLLPGISRGDLSPSLGRWAFLPFPPSLQGGQATQPPEFHAVTRQAGESLALGSVV